MRGFSNGCRCSSRGRRVIAISEPSSPASISATPAVSNTDREHSTPITGKTNKLGMAARVLSLAIERRGPVTAETFAPVKVDRLGICLSNALCSSDLRCAFHPAAAPPTSVMTRAFLCRAWGLPPGSRCAAVSACHRATGESYGQS